MGLVGRCARRYGADAALGVYPELRRSTRAASAECCERPASARTSVTRIAALGSRRALPRGTSAVPRRCMSTARSPDRSRQRRSVAQHAVEPERMHLPPSRGLRVRMSGPRRLRADLQVVRQVLAGTCARRGARPIGKLRSRRAGRARRPMARQQARDRPQRSPRPLEAGRRHDVADWRPARQRARRSHITRTFDDCGSSSRARSTTSPSGRTTTWAGPSSRACRRLAPLDVHRPGARLVHAGWQSSTVTSTRSGLLRRSRGRARRRHRLRRHLGGDGSARANHLGRGGHSGGRTSFAI